MLKAQFFPQYRRNEVDPSICERDSIAKQHRDAGRTAKLVVTVTCDITSLAWLGARRWMQREVVTGQEK
jgi:hypothetical protein